MPSLEQQAPADLDSPIHFPISNQWVTDSGKDYVVIDQLESFPPFFLSLASAEDQWLFCSSYGSLTAGRQSPDTALFPYYTVDKITDNWNTTGPWTAIVSDQQLWNPFRPSIGMTSPIRRRLMKSPLGDEIVFEEEHTELGLKLSYRWQLSQRFGFVRKVRITNTGKTPRNFSLVDGLENFLPPGISSRMQLEYSCLADAYKVSELDCDGALVIHRLAAGITDEPIPLESLLATTVWSVGMEQDETFLSRKGAEQFLRTSSHSKPGNISRATRGTMLLGKDIDLAPGENQDWMMVAEIGQSQADVSRLRQRLLRHPEQLREEVENDLRAGSEQLRKIVAASDGFQETADRDTALYHYNNTLCNILRGGTPENGTTLSLEAFLTYLELHNRPLLECHQGLLKILPERFQRRELIKKAENSGDIDFLRLTREYLPLILSRRHGDPSRPWNRFNIRLRDDEGTRVHHFEGNWRDIFQNWEALAWSYPTFLDGFIAKFLNASTIDGFNPYRITSEGVDWEAPNPDDPWASIGYWGDHQINYLLTLLELANQFAPESLTSRINEADYVFVDVPYRLAGWEKTLDDPRDTVSFDQEHHDELLQKKEKLGADGLLLCDSNGDLIRASLAEKLLLPAIVKLGNLVPGGGIWMNTQRPEWNDANNALAGCGLSVVTAAYLYRYLGFLQKLISDSNLPELDLSTDLIQLLGIMDSILEDSHWHSDTALAAEDRFKMVETAGLAMEQYRERVYQRNIKKTQALESKAILSFLHNARKSLEATLHQNQRGDGLWHSYNILKMSRGHFEIAHLPEMLEGQVAILSADFLNSAESLALLKSLENSQLRSERHDTYILYPDKDASSFLEINRVNEMELRAIPSLAQTQDPSIIVADPAGGFRFHSSLTNHYALSEALDAKPELAEDRKAIEALYESVFHHNFFTGRSGTMFGYEGLGCVYWHMVSKLMLAAQRLVNEEADKEVTLGLTRAYFSIQRGLGYRKTPEEYGAFPADPYSHSPGHAGAQQPGLTGQVKEGILCRFGELGVSFKKGQLSFHPILLREAEFANPTGAISFTIAGTKVVYRREENLARAKATIYLIDGSNVSAGGATLSRELTAEIIHQTQNIVKIEVDLPSSWLVPS